MWKAMKGSESSKDQDDFRFKEKLKQNEDVLTDGDIDDNNYEEWLNDNPDEEEEDD